MDNDLELRKQLVNLLTTAQAHMGFDEALADFPADYMNTRLTGCDYTFWHLLEHMRICQRDILDYIEADHYKWLNFPDDLWPDKSTTATVTAWQRSIDAFLADRRRLAEIVNNPHHDLFAALPNSGSSHHNILREINIISDHTAYHIGELAYARGMLGLWKKN
ncbi:MAG: DinB family protein [Anaerolineae bacterium]|nr:DinB family protein [Anaerolineae bacterium]